MFEQERRRRESLAQDKDKSASVKNIILPARSLGHFFIRKVVDKTLNDANACAHN